MTVLQAAKIDSNTAVNAHPWKQQSKYALVMCKTISPKFILNKQSSSQICRNHKAYSERDIRHQPIVRYLHKDTR